MKRKVSFCLLAFVMAIIMAVVSPAQVIATYTNKQYIKEIRIGYGEDGKKQLEAAHYTILRDSNDTAVDVNQGSIGDKVYLGYITTTNKEEAITDIALMPMGSDGDYGYSFKAYQEEMDNINLQITQKVKAFGAAIMEFRENYKKAAPDNQYALRAYTLLNMFTEDDTLVQTGVTKNTDGSETINYAPAKLGDLLLDESYVVEAGPIFSADYNPPQVYRNILMMGNSSVVQAINNALVLGCAETEGNTFLDRLAAAEYDATLDPTNNFARSTLAEIIDAFREVLVKAQDTYNIAVSFDGGVAAYIHQFDRNPATDTEEIVLNFRGEPFDAVTYNNVLEQITLIDIMKKIPYGDCLDADEENTLYFLDAMLISTDYDSNYGLVLNDQMVDMLAKSMTPGQISIAQYTGLAPLIFYAYNTRSDSYTTEDGQTYTTSDIIDEYISTTMPDETISVYAGVDRSIFNDTTNTVAITSAAIQRQASNGGLGAKPEYTEGNSTYQKVGIAGCVLAGVSVAAAIVESVRLFGSSTVVAKGAASLSAPSYKFTYISPTLGDSRTYIGTEARFETFRNDLSRRTGKEVAVTEKVSSSSNSSTNAVNSSSGSVFQSSLGAKIRLGFDVIVAIIGIIMAVVGFVKYKQSQELKDIDYSPIPRAIIDVRYKEDGGKAYYFNYYATKLPNVNDDDYKTQKDTFQLYGDLNAHNGKDPWLVLYYARDLRLGSPLTPNILFQNTSSLNSLKQPTYLPVHRFGYTTLEANSKGYTAFNLNQTNRQANAPELYLFFMRDTSVKTISATLFGDFFSWSSLASFLIGGTLTGCIVWFATKRKKYSKG